MAARLRGMGAHVNLIPVNPVAETGYRRGDRAAIERFQNELRLRGVNATIRRELALISAPHAAVAAAGRGCVNQRAGARDRRGKAALIRIFGATDQGRVRATNQDAFVYEVISEDTAYIVLCDGMGGENGGHIASARAVEIIGTRHCARAGGADATRINQADACFGRLGGQRSDS